MFRNHTVAIAIPCFNEESNLPNVVAGLPEWVDTVVIVDDASTDGTAAVAQRLISHDSRISVINHPKNLGVGAAIASAMMVLRESKRTSLLSWLAIIKWIQHSFQRSSSR